MPTQQVHTQLQVPRPSRAQIGFTLAHEQFPAPELVRLAIAAEEAGFDSIAASDHFHPWQDNQGHAGFAWITLDIIGQQTQRLHLGATVTCPTYRYNPPLWPRLSPPSVSSRRAVSIWEWELARRSTRSLLLEAGEIIRSGMTG